MWTSAGCSHTYVVALAAALAFTRAALFTCPRLECLQVSDGWREVFDSTHGRYFLARNVTIFHVAAFDSTRSSSTWQRACGLLVLGCWL